MALLFQNQEQGIRVGQGIVYETVCGRLLSGYTTYLRPIARTIETTSTQHQTGSETIPSKTKVKRYCRMSVGFVSRPLRAFCCVWYNQYKS